MEENGHIIIDENKNEGSDEIKNEEDNKKLLIEEDNKNINIKNSDNYINKQNTETLLSKDNIINTNNNIENENKNVIISDYIISIQYSKILHIPYFIFGNMLFFFCPCYKFKSEIINLSQMPTPPFGIVISECKKKSYINSLIFYF